MRSDQVLTDPQMGRPPERPGPARQVLDSLADPTQYAVLGAEWRRGLKDLQDLTVAFPDPMGRRDEAGTIGSPTPQIVTQEIQGKDLDLDR
jgi:hypothetical protein